MEMIDDAVTDLLHRGCFMNNTIIEFGTRDPEVARIIEANTAFWEALFMEVITRSQKHGELTTTTPARTLARFLITTRYGLQVSARCTQDRRELQEEVTLIMTVFLNTHPRKDHNL